MRGYRGSTEQLFWDKVDKSQDCWTWLGSLFKTGYGQFWNGEKVVRAHRYSYELLKGEIPKGLQLDHLCRNRYCVNPKHLEPVTNRENVLRGNGICGNNARKTHCKNGHLFNEENTINLKGNRRQCRICKKEYENNWHLARKVSQYGKIY